ncbi:MAG: CvpA family protein, partial [Dehalococcoidia bacterium]
MLWNVGLNWIDIVLLGMLAWSAWAGYRRGLVLEVLSLGRIIVGFALAALYGTTVGIEIQNATGLPPLLTPVIGVAAVFLVSQLALGLAIGLVAGPMIGVLHRLPIVGQLDRIGGIAIATLQTLMWLALGL